MQMLILAKVILTVFLKNQGIYFIYLIEAFNSA